MEDGPEPELRSAMKIWVDADAAPRAVKEIVYRAAQRVQVSAVLVANAPMSVPKGNAFVSLVIVSGGPDVADQYIADHAGPGDLAITADIPLAAVLVERRILTLDPRGQEYNAETVRERLSIRDFMDSMRGAGYETGGAKPYGERDKKAFAATLDRLLTAALKKR